MFKLIIKNLWGRRKRNLTLLIELIIVTVVAWASLDTVIVNLYVRNMPLGYDPSRLVIVTFGNAAFSAADDNPESFQRSLEQFNAMLKTLPEVESGSWIERTLLESSGFSCSVFGDSLHSVNVFNVSFIKGWNYFDVVGIKPVGRTPSTDELLNRGYARGECVVSESVARTFFGDMDAVGHYIGENDSDFNPDDAYKVVGVVTDIRPRSNESDAMVMYRPAPDWMLDSYLRYPEFCIRLKEGVSARAFINKYSDRIGGFKSGNLYVYKARPMTEAGEEYLYNSGYTNSMRLRVILAVFFLVNLFLGIVGIFLLQTRKRTEDAGVMLSFGATPRYIRRMLLGEGVVITTVSWAIGCIGYYFIAKSVGLATGIGNMNVDMRIDVPWIASFAQHFAIVSAIIYILILAAVLLGIYIPARRISRVNPVDALRDE